MEIPHPKEPVGNSNGRCRRIQGTGGRKSDDTAEKVQPAGIARAQLCVHQMGAGFPISI
jgi:hypothetical protein